MAQLAMVQWRKCTGKLNSAQTVNEQVVQTWCRMFCVQIEMWTPFCSVLYPISQMIGRITNQSSPVFSISWPSCPLCSCISHVRALTPSNMALQLFSSLSCYCSFYPVRQKLHPFYFLNNSVKPRSTLWFKKRANFSGLLLRPSSVDFNNF